MQLKYILVLAVLCVLIVTVLGGCWKSEDGKIICEDGYTRVPPSLNSEPDQEYIYKPKDTFALFCIASGNPPPQYKWTKNGADFILPDHVVQKAGQGTLQFSEATADDEGYYQCIAKNQLGTSLSQVCHVRPAVMGTSNDPKTIRKQPFIGTSVTLNCDAPRSFPDGELYWGHGPRESSIALNERVAMDTDGNLHFANVLKRDFAEGKGYTCTMYNKFLKASKFGSDYILSPRGEISEAERRAPATLFKSPSEVLILKGETLQLMCIFGGYPTPKVTWKKIGSDFGPRVSFPEGGQKCSIENVDFIDEGEYSCEGNNNFGNTEKHTFTVKVETKPYWETDGKPVDVHIEELEDVTMNCLAGAVPPPTIEWFINGEPIASVAASLRRTVSQNSIDFRGVVVADTCVVQCNATNKHGYIFADAYVNVLAQKPTFIKPPTANKSVVGWTVNIPCEVFAAPAPTISWRYENTPLTSSIRIEQKPNMLTIKNALKSDMGMYECEAKNKYGNIKNATRLIVRDPTQIQTSPQDKTVNVEDEARFECSAITDPEESHKLKIQWKHNGQLVDFSQRRFTLQDDSALVINPTSAQDSGTFTCVASNGLDSDEKTATLSVRAPPEPPTQVQVPECLQRSAKISWIPGSDNNSPIKEYIIEYNTTFNPDVWTELKRVDHPIYNTAVEVSPWANYTFRVRAVNDVGVSEPSVHSSTVCRIPGDRPDKNPNNTRVSDYDPYSLYILWDVLLPIDHNGPDFAYVVTYQQLDPVGDVVTETIPDYTKGDLIVKNQPTYKPYEVTVAARNRQGEARKQPTRVIGFSGENTPLVVPEDFRVDDTVKTGPTEASFIFTRITPTPGNIRGFFLGYEIQLWKTSQSRDDSPAFKHVIQINDPSNEGAEYRRDRNKRQDIVDEIVVTVPGLDPYSDYRAVVVVRNKKYGGPPSEEAPFTTPEGVPGPVNNLVVDKIGPVHMELKWEKPLKPNGVLRGYEVSYQEINDDGMLGPRVKAAEIKNPEDMNYKLKFLNPLTKYRVSVIAITTPGRGDEAITEDKTLAMIPPEEPELDVVAGPTSMDVTWVPAESNPGHGFYVQYRKPGSTDWSSSPIESDKDTITITRLDPGVEYEVRVVAVNYIPGSDDPVLGDKTMETPSQIMTTQTAGAAAAVRDISTAAWFIALLIVILLLIIILFIICIIRRSRGDRYYPDEKEQLNRYQPEAPPFQEFTRGNEPDPDTPMEDIKPPESDSDSLEDYGEGDVGKFNEDGSFIGQYGKGKGSSQTQEPTSPSALSTFV